MRAGFGKLVFIIRHDIEAQFREIIGARFEKRIAVEYVFQELHELPPGFAVPSGRTKPWGTTHAILHGCDVVREPFAAINADDFYGAQGFRLLAHHFKSGSPDYAMVGFVCATHFRSSAAWRAASAGWTDKAISSPLSR